MPDIDWTKAEKFVSSKKGADKAKKVRVIEAVRDGNVVHYRNAGAATSVCTSNGKRFDAVWKKAK